MRLASSRGKRDEPFAFVVDVGTVASRELRERRDSEVPVVLDIPRGRNEAVDKNRGENVAVLADDDAAELFGEDARPLGWRVGKQRGVPLRQEPDRRRRVAVREWRARQVEQHAAALVAEAA